ncbi:hypothetical protein [Desulfitobacterium sp. AusDCA]|uniref:hypothetical protein n=1 Tax=Desulfitobacterium sp. AusDCA TaxID=3240383 RepID=UPI003DA6D6D6
MRERGSALLTAVIAIMTLLLISGVFFTFINYHYKLESSEEKGLKAFYMAEAGINYGVAMVRNNPSEYYIDGKQMRLENPFDASGNPYKGIFEVIIHTSPSEDNYIFTLTSTGCYPDEHGIRRTLEEQYTFPKPNPAQP